MDLPVVRRSATARCICCWCPLRTHWAGPSMPTAICSCSTISSLSFLVHLGFNCVFHEAVATKTVVFLVQWTIQRNGGLKAIYISCRYSQPNRVKKLSTTPQEWTRKCMVSSFFLNTHYRERLGWWNVCRCLSPKLFLRREPSGSRLNTISGSATPCLRCMGPRRQGDWSGCQSWRHSCGTVFSGTPCLIV